MSKVENKIVSIIIPAYNAEIFLEETVTSALASTYTLLEIIIVNDGSTDNTQQIIDKVKLEHPEIRAIEQKNQGVAVARNAGIANSTGKYILPLDADDLISDDYVEKAVEILEQNPNVKMV